MYVIPALHSTREIDAGCAATPSASRSAAASSSSVMSGTASTTSTRKARLAASLPFPGGRPGFSGTSVPRSAWLAAIRTALLALIRKCRAAARRDPPASINCQTRSRRSSDNGLPMIHLQSG